MTATHGQYFQVHCTLVYHSPEFGRPRTLISRLSEYRCEGTVRRGRRLRVSSCTALGKLIAECWRSLSLKRNPIHIRRGVYSCRKISHPSIDIPRELVNSGCPIRCCSSWRLDPLYQQPQDTAKGEELGEFGYLPRPTLSNHRWHTARDSFHCRNAWKKCVDCANVLGDSCQLWAPSDRDTCKRTGRDSSHRVVGSYRWYCVESTPRAGLATY